MEKTQTKMIHLQSLSLHSANLFSKIQTQNSNRSVDCFKEIYKFLGRVLEKIDYFELKVFKSDGREFSIENSYEHDRCNNNNDERKTKRFVGDVLTSSSFKIQLHYECEL